jgi:PleD family two-component response regulator
MIERCDRALYHAKRSGRNCTVRETVVEGETAAA